MGNIGNKRKRPVTDDQIVAAYRDSLSVYQVERTLGVAATTIYRVLERHGVKRVGLQHYRKNAARFTKAVSRSIRSAYESGSSYADLVSRFGGTEYSIKEAIKRAGGALRPVCPPVTDEEERRIRELHAAGYSQMKISVALGRSQSFISRVFRRAGIPWTRTAGSSHPMWRGGRTVASGYVRVKVVSGDPFASMCDLSGYVAEHRLVLAKKIGRPLLPSETVHHINGDKTDNRPENLELRIGLHGKGAVMVCLDCGSHNIGHAPLTRTT